MHSQTESSCACWQIGHRPSPAYAFTIGFNSNASFSRINTDVPWEIGNIR